MMSRDEGSPYRSPKGQGSNIYTASTQRLDSINVHLSSGSNRGRGLFLMRWSASGDMRNRLRALKGAG